MNKNLFLIRHSKSEEKQPGQKDIDRVLTSDGIQAATKLGHYFKQEGIQPDMIICSPAIRANATAILIAEQIKYNTEQIHLNEELYEASVRILLQIVNRLKDDWDEVFIIAHNPVVSYLAEYITHSEIGSMDAAGFVQIKFPFKEWGNVSDGNGELITYKSPQDLGA